MEKSKKKIIKERTIEEEAQAITNAFIKVKKEGLETLDNLGVFRTVLYRLKAITKNQEFLLFDRKPPLTVK